jgi:hypothetical protein
MVDDVITASKCGSTSVALNSAVNTFMDQKKLRLSRDKCSQIHIGNKASTDQCHPHRVHQNKMKSSNKEKYLGDYVTSKANSKDTIIDRKSRGYAVLSRLGALLRDIPLGKKRTRTGIELRNAWFINGCLFNSEVWSGYNLNDLHDLEVIDHKIMRLITGAQAKVPTEMLYLETGQLQIKHVISIRRLMYLHTILTRNKDEITYKTYNAMKIKPLKDDWIYLVADDLKTIQMSLENEEDIVKLTKEQFKTIVKKRVRQTAFIELQEAKRNHSKVRDIKFQSLAVEEYITSAKFSNQQCSLLFNLRSKCVNEFKGNFQFGGQHFKCQVCMIENDTQEHALVCMSLRKHITPANVGKLDSVRYEDLFGPTEYQLKITEAYEEIIETRKKLRAPPGPRLPRHYTGPSG